MICRTARCANSNPYDLVRANLGRFVLRKTYADCFAYTDSGQTVIASVGVVFETTIGSGIENQGSWKPCPNLGACIWQTFRPRTAANRRSIFGGVSNFCSIYLEFERMPEQIVRIANEKDRQNKFTDLTSCLDII